MRRGHWRVFWQTSRIYMLTNYTYFITCRNQQQQQQYGEKTLEYKRIFMKVVKTFILFNWQ